MKFHIKLLTAAMALAASASAIAVVAPGGDLGTLTIYPTQFGAYRGVEDGGPQNRVPQAGDVNFSHEYLFTLATDATVYGSVSNFFFGDVTFTSVAVGFANAPGTLLSTSFDTPSNASFSFTGLKAGNYRLYVDGVYPVGVQAYSGSVYATAPAVPEPQSLALLLAGLGVTALVAQRRKKA